MAAETQTRSRPDLTALRRGAIIAYRWLILGFLLACLADNTALYGGPHALDGLLALGIAGFLARRPGDGRHEGRRAAHFLAHAASCHGSPRTTGETP